MKYGYFDDAQREYVITNPKTPVKWINYVGTLDFGGIVDHTGGALLCRRDPSLNRITKYIPQMPNSDFKGETLYLRFKQAESYKVFSPYYVPCCEDYTKFECRVGLSYQKFNSICCDIESEITVFVPVGSQVEVRLHKIVNRSPKALEIDAIPVAEFTHFDALKQFNNADWVPQTMQCRAQKDTQGCTVLVQSAFMKQETEVNFMSTDIPVDSFETDRQLFLGDNGYGSWRAPKSLQGASLSNTQALRGDNIGAMMLKLGTLAPRQTVEFVTLLGQSSPADLEKCCSAHRSVAGAKSELLKLTAFWDQYLSVFQCETPNDSFNTMINVHNPRQCHTTMNWSRYLSLYQLGLGERGIGFRDSSQDVLGTISGAPKESLNLIKKLLSVQKSDGSAMHQFFPLTMVANEGDSREEGLKEGKDVYGDDHLWIIFSVCTFIKETGDVDVLKEIIPFYDKKKPLDQRELGTVWEHLKRALQYTKSHCGKNGLPLLGFADWNDTVNLHGQAESCMVACMYGKALLEMIDLAKFLGHAELAQQWESDHQLMKDTFNRVAWDGEWYIRYFEENGTPLGSKSCAEGKIFTNGQSWPILSGFATPERAISALNSVKEKLNTSFGIKLSWPGYQKFDPKKGGVTTYPPGAKENGGIFLHANPWIIIAETLMGRGDRAFDYYNQINPAFRNDQIERYECEPYCYPQNILGDEHPQFGLARNTWLSGTSSWMYQAATQAILGIKPNYGGLEINPCIPKNWPVFSATRKFRGVVYKITVNNPQGLSKGKIELKVNGKTIAGQIVPVLVSLEPVVVEATILPCEA